MKLCKKCNIEKDLSFFYKDKTLKDGHRNECKICYNLKYDKKEYLKEYNKSNKEYRKEYNKEYKKSDNYKLKKTQYQKSYYVKNKYVIIERNKKRNMETNYYNNYRRKKYKNDIIYRNKCLLRTMLYDTFHSKGFIKNKKIENIIGCTVAEYILYIEEKFEIWMNWDNQGKYTGNYNETWQIDHIIPISSAKNEEEIIKLNHYTNLQPLCSRKNIEKSNLIMLPNCVTQLGNT